MDVEFLALAGALCHRLWTIGLVRAGYPDLARSRRDHCALHLFAQCIFRPRPLDPARGAGVAAIGSSLFCAAPRPGAAGNAGLCRRTDGGCRSPQLSVVATTATDGALGQSARRL